MSVDVTIEKAGEKVERRLELWERQWQERCRLLKDIEEGTYSKHILCVLPDLIEEVEHNDRWFSKNEYAKKFFNSIISRYCIGRVGKATKSNALTSPTQFASGFQSELSFVLEALQSGQARSDSFEIAHLSRCLHKIDDGLRTNESVCHTVRLLSDWLCDEAAEIDILEIIELCDTLILLFWRKGRLPESIEWLASHILSGIERWQNGDVYSQYPEAPAKGSLTNEEYQRVLTSFFANVTLKERFGQIIKVYSREPEEYELIFKVDGFAHGSGGFAVGDVTVYDPKQDSHVKPGVPEEKCIFLSKVESVGKNQLCISVRVRGNDSRSMKIQGKKKAERALGLISGRETKRNALALSDFYVVCDPSGKEVGGGTGELKGELLHTAELAAWKKGDYERFGQWINSDSAIRSVSIWLASMDWHRKAIECGQSSETLLNAWYSLEHLFRGGSRVSLRIPGFLRTRPAEKNVNVQWYADERIAQIQLILCLIETKHELKKYAGSLAHNFLPGGKLFFNLKYGKEFSLSKDVLSQFVEKDGAIYTSGGFVACSDEVIAELKASNLPALAREVQSMRDLFYDKETAMNRLRSELWRIKDDVYNTYRIRNMLVHRATTDSILTEYYAMRALEYSASLLTELKWSLLRTKDDSEIATIDEYFQDWVLDGNIGLESVQSGEMVKFRNWIFS
jgi:hypothetical protein